MAMGFFRVEWALLKLNRNLGEKIALIEEK